MRQASSPPADLVTGRRELDDVPGYERLADLAWRGDVGRWALHFRLHVPVPLDDVRDPNVPETTDWYALIAHEYPWGEIKIVPAADRGLVDTYAHQKANLPPRKGRPWRQGEICVITPAASFGRLVLDREPYEPAFRLWWHVARTRSWVEAARRGELLREGEPFELPDYPATDRPYVVFDGEAASIKRWTSCDARFGYATLSDSKVNSLLRVVRHFTASEAPYPDLVTASWGSLLDGQADRGTQHLAAWVLADHLPVVHPWKAPETWGELCACLQEAGIDLMDTMRRLAPRLRDGKEHLLLIGAPLSSRVGAAPTLVHWLAVRLPELSAKTSPRDGFRPTESGLWMRDESQVLKSNRPLVWVPTDNWSPDEIATRGRASSALRGARIVLIGAGAMGSVLAELLTREGAGQLTILDGEDLAIGNLVRHTLTIEAIGSGKASSLARRLNAANPYSSVTGIDQVFPGDARGVAALEQADIVIDTTGSDALIVQLRDHVWTGSRLFVSVAVGFYARRLFVFSARSTGFPADAFASAINPWLLHEREEVEGQEMPWEGTGCWHPVFPARASDFAILGGIALRQVEAALGLSEGEHELRVTERVEDRSGTVELRRATSRPQETSA